MDVRTAETARVHPRTADRRRHSRVRVALLGRYMLADRQEYPCQTVNMSPGGASLLAPVRGNVGERIVVYLEDVGRVEGEITRHTEEGFAISIAATFRKIDKLASQLTWLANRQVLGLPEDRRHERVIPRKQTSVLRLESGREFPVRIIDISLSGAAITGEQKFALGSSVVLGQTPGVVVRHFEGGTGVEFRLALSPDRFDENIVL